MLIGTLNYILKVISGRNLPFSYRNVVRVGESTSTRGKIRVLIRLFFVHPVKRVVAKIYVLVLQRFFGLCVIGITGSAGKTTTKEMLASILGYSKATVFSAANIDPVFNIPSTILKCSPKTRYLVLEMGIEYPSEMDFYLWMVVPDVGIITNIYPTHTEYLGDVDGVYKEKAKLVEKVSSQDGIVVLNYISPYLRKLERKLPKRKVVWYGDRNYYANHLKVTQRNTTLFDLHLGKKNVRIEIPVMGSQFVENAVVAACTAHLLGVDIKTIKKGLESFTPMSHRMQIVELGNIRIFDDSYNSNPKAAEVALENFFSISKRKKKIVVLGDMLELGEREVEYHKDVGSFIKKYYRHNPILICVGNLSKHTGKVASRLLKKVYFASDYMNAWKVLEKILIGNCDIFVKGSRKVNLDKLVLLLIDKYNL
jgi:UDP-N-acetylmuramoyl-tripeptide--D-alanyl-D-alanine ligase